jgi:hypothetical protein
MKRFQGMCSILLMIYFSEYNKINQKKEQRLAEEELTSLEI